VTHAGGSIVQVDRPEGGLAPSARPGPDRGWSLNASDRHDADRGWSLNASAHPSTDRGWSLDFSASRRVGASVGAILLTIAAAIAPATTLAAYDPAADVNSMLNTTAYTGATAWWGAGYTGRGVDVALIDTGVSPVDALAGSGKLLYGPDLSLESQAPNLTNLDTNGHGTFMAGLIAGNGSDYRGMAPGARIVSLKVGVADGGVDVSQVVAAIDWVVQHRNDDGLNIRAINLSYGTNSAQDYKVDPLAFAAEQAWKAGIVVVAAGGNYGFQSHMNNAPALADPAADPYLLAVGSTDSNGTLTTLDDSVPSFSPWPKRGATRGVDVVAPGAHIQGLRVRNGYLDVTYPDARLGGDYFRGSGTSESAAIMSGAVALILDKYPNATPDQVKRLLKTTGLDITAKAQQIGGGALQLATTLLAPLPSTGVSQQVWASSTGTGKLEGSRGTDHLTMDGVVLMGEQDIFGKSFDSAAMADLEATGNSWSGGTWNGSSWSGSSWSGSSWSGSSWSGSSWSGSSWSGSSWSGSSWSGSSWSGSSWSGSSWSGSSWSGSSWSTGAWE
jgi:serine protease AprX